MLRTILLTLALLALGGAAQAGTCEQRSPTVFALKGETDRAMADCVAAKLKPTTTELVVDSKGGNVDTTLLIAERLSTLNNLTIRVDGLCASSCANFFLPMGRKLVVGEIAVIQLHGGIDSALVAKSPPKDKAHLRASAERQLAFARAHRIPPGWLFYRTAEAPTRTDGLDGAFRWQVGAEDRYFIVETPLLRSCLPWLDVTAYDAWLRTQLTPERLARFKKNGWLPTGSVVCNGQGW